MGEAKAFNEARYIHGEFGKGTWTFYGGHDPEDYEHRVEEPPTDLSLHPNSISMMICDLHLYDHYSYCSYFISISKLPLYLAIFALTSETTVF